MSAPEKMIKESGDKLTAGDKEKIETAVKAVKEALNGTDAGAIKAASEKLNQTWQAVSAELYKDAQQKGPAGATKSDGPEQGEPEAENKKSSKDEGPIIDAEVVDEKKS